MKIDKGFGYKKCGIYCIKNIKNNKCYIGSSIHIYYRLRRHKSDLIRNVHVNPILQNSYNKNGEEAFTVSILEECTPDIVLQKEQYYINTICPEYNITKEVINNRPSAESRMKTSNTMKAKAKAGIRVNCMNYNKRKLIELYDCNCKLLKKFDSYNDAGRHIKTIYPMFTPDSVSSIVKSKFGKYKDYFLIVPGNTCNSNIPQKSYHLLITNTVTEESYTFNTATEAGKHLKCSRSAVLKALSKQKLLLKLYKIQKL